MAFDYMAYPGLARALGIGVVDPAGDNQAARLMRGHDVAALTRAITDAYGQNGPGAPAAPQPTFRLPPQGIVDPAPAPQAYTDANAGALAMGLSGLNGPQEGDDAPNAPVPVAKPKRGGKKKVAPPLPPQDDQPPPPAPVQPDPAPQPQWNERQAYDTPQEAQGSPGGGPRALFPDQLPPPQPQPAQPQQPTPAQPSGPGMLAGIGGALKSALGNQDLADLLSGVGVGLLSGKHTNQGLAQGLMLADERIRQRRQMEMRQKQLDAETAARSRGLDLEQRGQDIGDQHFTASQTQQADQFGQEMGYKGRSLDQNAAQFGQELGLKNRSLDQSASQFGQELGLKRDDMALRRDENAAVQRARASQLALSERELNERMTNDQATRGFQRDQLAEAARQHDMEYGGPKSVQFLPSEDGQGTVAVKTNRDGSISTEPVSGVSAGRQLAAQQNKSDIAAEQGMAGRASAALDTVDTVDRMQQVLDKNPSGVGPDVVNSAQRLVATTLGLPGANPVQELQNLAASGQLDTAVAKLKGQGPVSDMERRLISSVAANPTAMSADTLKQLLPAMRRRSEEDIGVYNDYLAQNPDRSKTATAYEYQNRFNRRKAEGGPRSGASPSSTSGGRSVTVGDKTISYSVE